MLRISWVTIVSILLVAVVCLGCMHGDLEEQSCEVIASGIAGDVTRLTGVVTAYFASEKEWPANRDAIVGFMCGPSNEWVSAACSLWDEIDHARYKNMEFCPLRNGSLRIDCYLHSTVVAGTYSVTVSPPQ